MTLQEAKVKKFYNKIKYVFNDPTPLNTVIIRVGSLLNSDSNTIKYFERLELLGDSVLNMVVSDMLFGYFPKEPSGVLSKVKAKLISSNTLVNVSEVVGLPMFLDAYSDKIKTTNILENAVEALIGAIYTDGGFVNAKSFIVREWEDKVRNSSINEEPCKSALQIWTQKNRKPLPKYYVVKCYGPRDNLRFKIGVSVEGVGRSCAMGSTIKEAESKAASILLNKINSDEGLGTDKLSHSIRSKGE